MLELTARIIRRIQALAAAHVGSDSFVRIIASTSSRSQCINGLDIRHDSPLLLL